MIFTKVSEFEWQLAVARYISKYSTICRIKSSRDDSCTRKPRCKTSATLEMLICADSSLGSSQISEPPVLLSRLNFCRPLLSPPASSESNPELSFARHCFQLVSHARISSFSLRSSAKSFDVCPASIR